MSALIPPITPAEFFHYLQRCIPPTGWSHRIAVANSGGPDSTALLFLLNAVVSAHRDPAPGDHPPRHRLGFPQAVASIHVNHNMQVAAVAMEQTAEETAYRIGVNLRRIELIPWAREARYNRLFSAMRVLRADVIAFGHHADDQVETAIMRMTQGSGPKGIAAMRPVRRWGMGNKANEYSEYGAEGMRRWIVRPFLHISKDRLLATCEANGLDYVVDPTNVQPSITFRNKVRHVLSGKEPDDTVGATSAGHSPYIQQLRAMVPDVRPADQLREAVRQFGIRLEEVETQVTNLIERARVPSPPSTLLFQSSVLNEATDDEVRIAFIRRCIRYASIGPWGAVWSEASGSRDTLRRIVTELWPDPPRPPPSTWRIDPETNVPEDPRRKFTAAAGVLVYPVAVQLETGKVRLRAPSPQDTHEVEGWLFAREPTSHARPEASAVLDVTDGLNAARAAGRRRHSVLYDYRFAVDFDLTRGLPKVVEIGLAQGARLTIEPDTKWALPQVILWGEGMKKPLCVGKYLWRAKGWKETCTRPTPLQSWIKMHFVRSLDAI
ncbi:hypothetical protein BD413DRAFT_659790 [Trametes elegans]|nr:hypothetical protein BD413DRAFT_659790 [Trametes elegans]